MPGRRATSTPWRRGRRASSGTTSRLGTTRSGGARSWREPTPRGLLVHALGWQATQASNWGHGTMSWTTCSPWPRRCSASVDWTRRTSLRTCSERRLSSPRRSSGHRSSSACSRSSIGWRRVPAAREPTARWPSPPGAPGSLSVRRTSPPPTPRCAGPPTSPIAVIGRCSWQSGRSVSPIPTRRPEVDAFLGQMRPWASDAGIAGLAPAFDRLEGRVRLADGDVRGRAEAPHSRRARVRRSWTPAGKPPAPGSTWRAPSWLPAITIGHTQRSGRQHRWWKSCGRWTRSKPPRGSGLRSIRPDAIRGRAGRRPSGGLLLAVAALLRGLLVRHQGGVHAGEHDVLVHEALGDVLA